LPQDDTATHDKPSEHESQSGTLCQHSNVAQGDDHRLRLMNLRVTPMTGLD